MISTQNPGSESAKMGTMKALHQALFQVEGLKDTLSQREQKISKQQSEIERLSAHVQWLERQMKLDRARRFGAASETSHSLQRELFNEAEMLVDQADDGQGNEPITVEAHQRKRRPRTPTIHDDLVKEIVTHELDETERVCPHDQAFLKAIGYDARRELKIIPEQVWAVEHRYINYACPCCDKTIKSTPREPRISQGLCSPQAAAAVATNKYVDHLPLYRQSERFARVGVPVDRATLGRWMIGHGEATQPLVNLMQDVVRDYPYQQLDETPVKVLKTKKKKSKGAQQGYLWVQRGGPPDRPVILYNYDPSRAGGVARGLLADFTGCVQTDGYPTYIRVMADLKVIHALCNVHARRRFTDVIKAGRDSHHQSAGHANIAIEYYKQLYRIEAELREDRDRTDPQTWYQHRLQQRQEQSRPIFEELIQWGDDLLHRVPPKSSLGDALGYLVKHRTGLGVFLDNGMVEMDNNLVENRIRPVALGRRNWLFSDTEHGVRASANLYSLINTAMLNGHNPYTYLVHIFKELPRANTLEEFEALLPWNVKPDMLEKL
ncbi:MAG TPA: IS66 family transposase [Gammaproteobacteria bacterium]|nr:IS66 family transposase [Gammaproteobacteria bacterium]